ncbi:tetratricopeptide repeat protein [Paenibacillus sp. 28ISP30-2]|uniref:tetratricopeptide repeat protein n=1 Tax=Paenibacillus TaxID=44249 RepID=UPI000721AE04|nr:MULTISPECIES: tetratricopeptide repeat protein [Paenibacillus]ALP38690.1 anaphase-promoting protein [Paenibacillus sp. IHB B 3084]MBE0335856.1 tetratricopeptide repeat protein [Paenibacillus sp. 23TSA30-6]MBE0343262.1 tetratricopeptide repeat protein [Paenibacillus sp. 28ISP30-2]
MKAEEYVQKAYQCILKNDFEQAVEWFEKAISAQPDHAEHYFRCSVTYARSGRIEQALAYAGDAVRLAPQQDEYVLHLHTLEARQQTEKARKMLDVDKATPQVRRDAILLLERAIALDPLCGDAFMLLALVYAEMNEYKLAVQAAREAAALFPHNEQLANLMKKLCQQMNEQI